jgi:quercetin dioxygenase-like cupin family protein
MSRPIVRRARDGFRWEGVELLRYKEEGVAPFRDVTRQVLFDEAPAGTQWRYFEVAPGGHSTLERHEHTHAVLVLRGRGRVLVGDEVHAIRAHDLVEIGPMTWHQFRAAPDDALGFLCLVASDRDRPQLPDERQLAELRANPVVARFLDGVHGHPSER